MTKDCPRHGYEPIYLCLFAIQQKYTGQLPCPGYERPKQIFITRWVVKR